MSFDTYYSQLTPDPWLRIALQVSGQLLCLAGLIILLFLPVSNLVRLLGCVLWVAHSALEIRRLQSGFDTIRRLRIHAGGAVEVQNSHSEWLPVTLQAGSVVLGQVAWLRLKASNGKPMAELLRRSTQCDEDWRHLQVIWRHIGASA